MSASERLKVLDDVRENAPMGWSWGPAHEGNADWHEVTNSLVAALPQIVAVVEAAESGYTEENEDATRCGCCHRLEWRGHASDCPLVALEEVLTNPQRKD